MPTTNRKSSPAFSLIEMLVVIGIITVVVLLAIPVLNVLQGNRSVDTAQNQLQALLNEARMMAIGVQRDSGVFFYLDPNTQRVQTVLVQASLPQPTDHPQVDVYLDLVHDHESVPLTLGLALQVIDNATVQPPSGPTAARIDDGYIGFNPNDPNNPVTIRYGGVILFDQHGQLVSRTYAFRIGYTVPVGPPQWSDMGKLIMLNATPNPAAGYIIPGQSAPGAGGSPLIPPPPQSKFGLVVFNAEAFRGQDFSSEDTQIGGGGFDNEMVSPPPLSGYTSAGASGRSEKDEEDWLDQNSVPLMVNRYNGTLIRGE